MVANPQEGSTQRRIPLLVHSTSASWSTRRRRRKICSTKARRSWTSRSPKQTRKESAGLRSSASRTWATRYHVCFVMLLICAFRGANVGARPLTHSQLMHCSLQQMQKPWRFPSRMPLSPRTNASSRLLLQVQLVLLLSLGCCNCMERPDIPMRRTIDAFGV